MATRESEHSKPARLCAGCRERRAARELIRLTGVDGRVVPDLERRLGGRGAHLCARRSCVDRALRRGRLGRTLRLRVQLEAEDLYTLLGEALEERLRSFVSNALRSETGAIERAAAIALLEALGSARPIGSTPPAFSRSRTQTRARWLWEGLSEFTSTQADANNPRLGAGGSHSVS